MHLSKLLPEPLRDRRVWLTRQQVSNPYPAFLYKYRSGQEKFLDRLIVHNELYFAHREDFNDPFDAQCHVVYGGSGSQKRARFQKLMRDNRVPFKQRDLLWRQFLDPAGSTALVQSSFDAAADMFGIHSLTENPKSLLMWGHYAAEHRGICLQFYVPSDPAFLKTFPVRYSDSLTTADWVTDSDAERWALNALLTKSTEWKYEEEWRMFERGRARVAVPVSPKALVGVIYGARCPSATMDRVRLLIAERERAGHPPMYEWQARLSPKHYGLGIFTAGNPAPRYWEGRASTRVKSVAANSDDARAPQVESSA